MNLKALLNKNTLVNSAIWYTIGTFALKGINFFTTPIFTRLLSTNDYGIITIYSTWVAIFSIIIGLGMNGTIGSAKIHLSKEKYKEYLSSILFLSTLSFIAALSFVMIFKEQCVSLIGLSYEILILLVVESYFGFVISFATSVCTFEKDHKNYLLTSFASTIINIALSIILILNLNNDLYLGRIIGSVVGVSSVGLIWYFIIILRGKVFFKLEYYKFCLPMALPLIFHNLSHLILNQADKLMLQKMTNEQVVGVYGFSYTIAALLNTIQLALNSAWLPWYYEILSKNDTKNLRSTAIKYLAFFTLLTSLFMLGSSEIIKLFAPSTYWSGIQILPVVIAGYYFVFLYTFPANYQFYLKKTKFIALGTISAAIINIILNLVLIPYLGMFGAALATLIAYIWLFAMHFSIVKYKYKHQDFEAKIYAIAIIWITLILGLSYALVNFWYIRWILIIILSLGSVLYVIKELRGTNNGTN